MPFSSFSAFVRFHLVMRKLPIFHSLLPPANVVCEGYVFTGVCLSTGRGGAASVYAGIYPPPRRPPTRETPLPRRPPLPRRHPLHTQGEIEGHQVQAHSQGGNWGGSDPGLHPRGKLRGIRSRPTPKGEIQGDQIQAHTQGGNSGGSGPDPPQRWLLLRAVRILLECILVSKTKFVRKYRGIYMYIYYNIPIHVM